MILNFTYQMKARLILSIFLVLCGISAKAQSGDGSVVFEAFQGYYPPYKIERFANQETEIDVLLGEKSQKQFVSSRMKTIQEISPANSNEDLQKLSMWVVDISGKMQSSEMNIDIPNVDTSISKVMYQLDQNGAITDFGGNEEYLKSLTQTGLFAIQKGRNLWSFLRNKRPLRLGDTLIEGQKGKPMTYTSKYILQNVESGIAIFKVLQDIEISQEYEAQGLQMTQNVKGNMNGFMKVRISDRMVTETNYDLFLEGSMDMVYIKTPLTIRGNISEKAKQI